MATVSQIKRCKHKKNYSTYIHVSDKIVQQDDILGHFPLFYINMSYTFIITLLGALGIYGDSLVYYNKF
ncbi:uncharacterized protein BX663DRAFT_521346 [Cokeromyces recurvatus]|uniref:uncharacterized protein n=1 Tax=Cokeromyces recurvatus TaxID=90255 RepID=UPI0022208D5E|nr:uncharacterized protein BX663DRAFT_521346 [Cokeromyces recurvatus]KAI7899334.1 hypothetical protein BX663DRAFT_521346 [Cokeromyces recurvatus]